MLQNSILVKTENEVCSKEKHDVMKSDLYVRETTTSVTMRLDPICHLLNNTKLRA